MKISPNISVAGSPSSAESGRIGSNGHRSRPLLSRGSPGGLSVPAGAGYTLLEVLVTCVLIGLLVGGLAHVLTHFTKNLVLLQRRMPSQLVVQTAARFVAEDLESCNRVSVMNRLPNPGFEDFTNPPMNNQTTIQDRWTYLCPQMGPFPMGNNVDASFITASTAGIHGVRAVFLSTQLGGLPFKVQSSTFVATYGGNYLVGARVWRQSGDSDLFVEIHTNPLSGVPVFQAIYPSGQSNWAFLSGSFVATAGQTYQMRFLVSGGTGAKFVVDDAYCGPSTVQVTPGNAMEPLFFSRTNSSGQQLNICYSMVGSSGNYKLYRSVCDYLGNQTDMVFDGITSLVVSRDPANPNWLDQPLRVQIQGRGTSQGSTDLVTAQLEVYPRAP